MKSCFLSARRSRGVHTLAPLVGLLALLSGASCDGGQSGAEVATGDPVRDDVPDGRGCQVDDDCRKHALALLETLAAPQSLCFEPSDSSCQAYGVILPDREISGPACTCNFPSVGSRMLGPIGVGCSVAGRGGDCLWSDAEFSGCSISDPHSCDASCAELGQRLAADAARSFQTQLVYAACEQGSCQDVVSIDGQCYANDSFQQGKSYECGLGTQAILKANELDSQPPKRINLQNDSWVYYQPGTDATVQLTVSRDYWGTTPGPLEFGVSAQFFDLSAKDVSYGDVLDPLEGVGDCGVVRGSGVGAAANIHFLNVDRAVLRDGDRELPLEESRSSSDSYYSYNLDLAAAGAQPHVGAGMYGFSASGGTFGASVDLQIGLTPPLSSPELEATSHFERGDLALTWTGGSANALQLSLDVTPQIDDPNDAYHVECRLYDNGAFTIPAAVLQAVPDGFARLTLRRAGRGIVGSGGKHVQTITQAVANHRFVIGPTCDGSALMAACQRSANTIRSRYQECSDLQPPPLEQLCPDYLATACGSCPEYFDCLAASTTCENGALTTRPGCTCPH